MFILCKTSEEEDINISGPGLVKLMFINYTPGWVRTPDLLHMSSALKPLHYTRYSACIERCHWWSRTTSKGRAEARLTSAETRNAGAKSTTIASRVGMSRREGWRSRSKDFDKMCRLLRLKWRSEPPPLLVFD